MTELTKKMMENKPHLKIAEKVIIINSWTLSCMKRKRRKKPKIKSKMDSVEETKIPSVLLPLIIIINNKLILINLKMKMPNQFLLQVSFKLQKDPPKKNKNSITSKDRKPFQVICSSKERLQKKILLVTM